MAHDSLAACMTTFSAQNALAHRLLWLDAAKGSAIVLVVFGHVLGGAMARGWLNQDGSALTTYDFIYLFHIPLFFLIGGAFAINGVRANPTAALLSRLGSILWPYIVWGTSDILLSPLIDRFRSFPHNDPNLLPDLITCCWVSGLGFYGHSSLLIAC